MANDAERRLYGDLLPDVQYLRDRGHVVARFKGMYRIDREVVSAAGLRDRANVERKAAPPAAPRAPLRSFAIAPPKPVMPRCSKCGEPRTDEQAVCEFCRAAMAEEAAREAIPTPEREVDPPRADDADKFTRIAKSRAPQLTADQEQRLHAAIAAGDGVREAARKAGVSTSTAHKHAERRTPDGLRCGCGRPNTHNGRCWARRAQSGVNLVARVADLEREVAELKARLDRVTVPA